MRHAISTRVFISRLTENRLQTVLKPLPTSMTLFWQFRILKFFRFSLVYWFMARPELNRAGNLRSGRFFK